MYPGNFWYPTMVAVILVPGGFVVLVVFVVVGLQVLLMNVWPVGQIHVTPLEVEPPGHATQAFPLRYVFGGQLQTEPLKEVPWGHAMQVPLML